MSSNDLLIDGFGRIRESVHQVLDGLDSDSLDFRADAAANSISWLIWHLTRIQDDHIAAAGGLEQVWLSDGWEERCGLPLDPLDTGYGHGSEDVAVVLLGEDLLTGYHDATYERTVSFINSLTEADMGKIVDQRWDPPVTMATRLVSVLADDLEHAGQAAFIKGLLDRRD